MSESHLANGPTHLQIEPTTRCNFTCGFCAGRHMSQGDLTFEQFCSIIDQLPTLRYLHLQGEGEPLLNPAFFAMARYAKAKDLQLSLITNGSLLNKQAIDQLIELEFQWIGVSLESVNGERFRMIRGGLLEKVLRNLRELIRTRNELKRKEPIVSFCVTVMTSTLHEVDKIVELSDELGLSPPYFQSLEAKEDYSRFYTQKLLNEIPSEEMMLPVRAWETKHRKWRVSNNISNYYDELWKNWDQPGCAFVARSMYIEHSGDVTPCCMIKDHNHPRIGNALKEDLSGLWHNTQRILINTNLANGISPSFCKDCVVVKDMEAQGLLSHNKETKD